LTGSWKYKNTFSDAILLKDGIAVLSSLKQKYTGIYRSISYRDNTARDGNKSRKQFNFERLCYIYQNL